MAAENVEASNMGSSVELIAQRVDQLERENAQLRIGQQQNTAAVEQAKGRSGLLSIVFPTATVLIGVIFGSVIFAQLQTATTTGNENRLAIATLESKLTTETNKLDDTIRRKGELRAEFDMHVNQTGHPRLEEKVAVLQKNMSEDDSMQLEQQATITKLEGLVARAHLLIETSQADIEKLSDNSTGNTRSIASMAASVEAHLKELETQQRAAYEKMTDMGKSFDRLVSILWQKVMESPLPDYDHTPSKIPADATSELGTIKTNGH